MSEGETALFKRLHNLAIALRATPGLVNTPLDLNLAEITLLTSALERPVARETCASTTNYPVMAERALRLISRNQISGVEAIEAIAHLVDCAGYDAAVAEIADDDHVPF